MTVYQHVNIHRPSQRIQRFKVSVRNALMTMNDTDPELWMGDDL